MKYLRVHACVWCEEGVVFEGRCNNCGVENQAEMAYFVRFDRRRKILDHLLGIGLMLAVAALIWFAYKGAF